MFGLGTVVAGCEKGDEGDFRLLMYSLSPPAQSTHSLTHRGITKKDTISDARWRWNGDIDGTSLFRIISLPQRSQLTWNCPTFIFWRNKHTSYFFLSWPGVSPVVGRRPIRNPGCRIITAIRLFCSRVIISNVFALKYDPTNPCQTFSNLSFTHVTVTGASFWKEMRTSFFFFCSVYFRLHLHL